MKFEKSRLEPMKLELGGVKYPIQVTFSTMADFEEYFNLSYTKVLDKLLEQNLNTKELQFVLFKILQTGGVELALEDLDTVDFTIDTLSVLTDALMRANKVLSILTEAIEADEDDKKKTETA